MGGQSRPEATLYPTEEGHQGGKAEEALRIPGLRERGPSAPIPGVRTASSQCPETGVQESGHEVMTGKGLDHL